MTDIKPTILLPTILLIDDDPNDQELARVALAKSGVPHELVVLNDGAEGLAWLEKSGINHEFPSLVLLDLKMPKVSGLEVLKFVRQNPKMKFLPIIIFTSSAEEADLSRCSEQIANAYTRKPNDFSDYKATMSDIARFWILRNQTMSLGKGDANHDA